MRRIFSLISTVLAVGALLAAAPTSAAPGDLDLTFGAGTGKVMTAIGTGHDHGQAIALQPDGKIVVAGFCRGASNDDFCLARYQANGTLDPSFNSTGKVISPIASSKDVGKAIALQPDGKIVVAGHCLNGSNWDFCLARYLVNGALDLSFNTTGKVISHIGSSPNYVFTIALHPDGKIAVAGYCWNGSNYDVCLARYLPNGTLDASFGSSGKVISHIDSYSRGGNAIALQSDGKIVFAGNCLNGSNWDFCLARYLANGMPDAGFGSDGKAISPIRSSDDLAFAIALQPDGKMVVAGYCGVHTKYNLCVARHKSDGTLDTSFGKGGTVISPIGTVDGRYQAIALQPDDKIVLAGFCSSDRTYDFCLARYEGGR